MTDNKKQGADNISRRELLIGIGAAAVAFAPVAGAMEGKHDHSKHKPQQSDVLDAVNGCLDKGQRCIAHCLTLFQEGDTSVADCASKVHEMQAICGAFSYLLASNSSHVKATSKLCKALCEECAEECRKHDKHHECRECADACEATVAAIKKTIG